MRLPEAARGAAAGLDVFLHLRFAKACALQVLLDGGALQHAGSDLALHLQDQNDLVHRAERNLPIELDALFHDAGKILG